MSNVGGYQQVLVSSKLALLVELLNVEHQVSVWSCEQSRTFWKYKTYLSKDCDEVPITFMRIFN